jgi:AmmeMemoRadiSam system protein B
MIRKPAVAGMFYSIEPELLGKQVEKFMLSAKTKPSCIGVISPHAGYGYSGQTAAWAINSLKPADTYIVLGPNHTGCGHEFSLMAEGSWATPLGNAEIDENIAAEIMRRTDIADDASAHAGEHSIEVQIPFLQKRFKSFRFVPVCIMNTDYSDSFMDKCITTGEIIAEIVKHSLKSGKKIGLIASSDFSHYVRPDLIERMEKPIVKAILELNIPRFFDILSSSDASVCGYGPIAVLMAFAGKMGLRARSIDSSNSGGDSAVSYRAIGFE